MTRASQTTTQMKQTKKAKITRQLGHRLLT